MTEISPQSLDTRLQADSENPIVLDIRHSDEFADWHIPGSENIDVYDDLKNDQEKAAARLRRLPLDREIVTVCAAGVLSAQATELLREMDYDAKTLTDGMIGWSQVHRSAPIDVDIDGILIQVSRPGKGCLSYVLVSNREAIVIDPSYYHGVYETLIDEYDASLVGVYDTHAHADHVSGGRKLADGNDVPYHLHPADANTLDAKPLKDKERFAIGNVDIEVIHTPGHSPGAVTYVLDDEALLTGDTLFPKSVGRVELGAEAGIEETPVQENAATLYESLERILTLSGDPFVLAAHDPGSPDPPIATRLSLVREQNPDIGRPREDFIADLASDIPDHPPNFRQVKRANIGAEPIADEEIGTLELGPNNCAAE